MDHSSIYCVAGVHSSPMEMNVNEEKTKVHRFVSLPLPEQINVFMVGDKDKFPTDRVIDFMFQYEGVEFKLGCLTKNSRSLVWERKKCDDTLPELLKNSCDGMVSLLGMVKQVMGVACQNLPNQERPFKKLKTKNIQEELENTPQAVTPKTPVSNKRPSKTRGKKIAPGERTPKGPTPRKGKIATRMRALKNEGISNKSGTVSTNEEIEGVTETGSHRLSVCKDVTNRVNPCPSKRWGHTMCLVEGKQVVLIGGQGEKQQLNRDSVWTLNTETRRWSDIKTEVEGPNPELRMGHTATYDPIVKCIYVYGGSKNLKWFRDVYMLDLTNWKWQLMKVNGKAPMRAYHTATLYRHELWIFGGVFPLPNPQPDGCSNELHIFSPVMDNWYSPIVTGEKPLARSGHSATLLGDQLVIFGGWDAPFCYSDTFILDMTLLDWSQPTIIGTPPKPRSWHASCALSGNRVLIHGGYDGDLALNDTHIFNLNDKSWTCIKMEPVSSPRTGHVALCLPFYHHNDETDEVVIFGGGDNDGSFYSDLLSVNIPLNPLPEIVKST